jgi:hypothetical protein
MSKNKQSSVDKEFVPYEEALALKELGFDEPCFGYYGNSEEDSTIVLELRTISQEGDLAKRICSAPTYSQAFRWFRDKHNFHSNVKCINTTYNNHFRFEIESNSETLYCRNLFDTHEEAELECLKKLIEIVKLDNNDK